MQEKRGWDAGCGMRDAGCGIPKVAGTGRNGTAIYFATLRNILQYKLKSTKRQKPQRKVYSVREVGSSETPVPPPHLSKLHELFEPTIELSKRKTLNREGFQLIVESKYAFVSVLLYSAIWLVRKTRATFLTNQICQTKSNCDLVARVFPRLASVTCICFEFSLVHCAVYAVRLLWLARVITLVWFYYTQLKTALILPPLLDVICAWA